LPDPDFIFQQHDTASPLRATLEDQNGDPVDIQAASVILRMAPIAGGTLALAGTAVVDQIGAGTATGGSMGVVHYNWPASGLSAGLYAGEWQTTYLSGTIQSFPNGDPMLILVTKDLG